MNSFPNDHEKAILSLQQIAAADKLTIQRGTSGFKLLSAAGRRVYEVVRGFVADNDRILVACGSGNNGGDGLVAAKLLLDDGFDVQIALLGSPESVQGDARLALDALNHPIHALSEVSPDKFTIIIDALLGTGIDRPVTGQLAQWIAEANATNAMIFSVDIASGIQGDSGRVMGAAMHAHHTVTFFRKKPGHLIFPGRQHCGLVHVKQIGIEPSILQELQPKIFENHPRLWRDSMPVSGWNSHKYTRGHTVVVTGDAVSTGAARLAAHAALRAGAGLVSLACPTAAARVVASQVTCEMIEVIDTSDDLQRMLEDSRITSVVLGPGMGVGLHTRQMVRTALSSDAAVVLDADALTSFDQRQEDLYQFISKAKGGVILTPHAGEFKRLFSGFNQMLETSSLPSNFGLSANSKIDLSREAAMLSGATVVNKGCDTVIAEPAGNCVVNSNAPVWLATAGSGDVLAGTIAGWMSQGVDSFHSACIGCWMHGEAANEFGPGLIASDIATRYPQIHRNLTSRTE